MGGKFTLVCAYAGVIVIQINHLSAVEIKNTCFLKNIFKYQNSIQAQHFA